MLVEKTYRAEYESEKIGFITASIAGECMQRLSSGTRAVQVMANHTYDKAFPLYVELLRQNRLSGLDLLGYNRSEHIKKIYQTSINYQNK